MFIFACVLVFIEKNLRPGHEIILVIQILPKMILVVTIILEANIVF